MSGDLRSIKRRIVTIRNIQKIAKAMKMVASAKLYKVQPHLDRFRPYALQMWRHIGRIYHPEDGEKLFFQRDEGRRPLLLVIASDRGMCGSYNAHVTKLAESFLEERGGEVDVLVMGKKAHERLRMVGVEPVHVFPGPSGHEDEDRELISRLRTLVLSRIEAYDNDSFHVAFTRFVSPLRQEPEIRKIIPLEGDPELHPDPVNDYTYYEPEREEMVELLLPVAFEIFMEWMVLESLASELGARMTAMDGASKNAEDLLEDLTIQYNKARQAMITKELMEIIGGFEVIS